MLFNCICLLDSQLPCPSYKLTANSAAPVGSVQQGHPRWRGCWAALSASQSHAIPWLPLQVLCRSCAARQGVRPAWLQAVQSVWQCHADSWLPLQVLCSKDIKVAGLLGSAAPTEKKSNLVSDQQLGMGGTTAWRLATMVSSTGQLGTWLGRLCACLQCCSVSSMQLALWGLELWRPYWLPGQACSWLTPCRRQHSLGCIAQHTLAAPQTS